MAGVQACKTLLQQRPCVSQKDNVRLCTFHKPKNGELRAALRSGLCRSSRRPSLRAAASAASNKAYVGSLAGNGLSMGVVVARFNDLVTKPMLEGALEAFGRHGVAADAVDVAWVPGSFELPVVAKAMAKSGKYDAVVCIGAVIRGATSHYDAVVGAATSGCLGASSDTGVPVVFGVITTENMEQALDRAGGKVGNKGAEAAITAVEMANLLKTLKADGKAHAPW